MQTFSLDVSYAQICVFDSTLASPFNDWTDGHVRQGFSWRPGSVSFATLDAAGKILVRFDRASQVDWSRSVGARIITVPFSVPPHGAVEVATITGSVALVLAAGEYELTFEHGQDADGAMWATFHFRPVAAPVAAKVVRADAALSPAAELVMTAQPA